MTTQESHQSGDADAKKQQTELDRAINYANTVQHTSPTTTEQQEASASSTQQPPQSDATS